LNEEPVSESVSVGNVVTNLGMISGDMCMYVRISFSIDFSPVLEIARANLYVL
jgi:hypothetical protein